MGRPAMVALASPAKGDYEQREGGDMERERERERECVKYRELEMKVHLEGG